MLGLWRGFNNLKQKVKKCKTKVTRCEEGSKFKYEVFLTPCENVWKSALENNKGIVQ